MSTHARRSPAARGREMIDGSGQPDCARGVGERHADGALPDIDARRRSIRNGGVPVRFAAQHDPIGFVAPTGCNPAGGDVDLESARDSAPGRRSGGQRPLRDRPRAVLSQRTALV